MLVARDLIENKIYRQWLDRPPAEPNSARAYAPWRLYVRREGRWKRAAVWWYDEGLRAFLHYAQTDEDAALTCTWRPTPPPRVKRGETFVWWQHPDQDTREQWCPYCRRPVVFRPFYRHHALRQFDGLLDWSENRCAICGISQTEAENQLGRWMKREEIV